MSKKDELQEKRLPIFEVEAAEHVQAISSGLVELAKEPASEERAGLLEAIYREAHSLKGAARAVDLPDVETVCQSLESVFADLKKGEMTTSSGLFDVLHMAVDAVVKLVVAPGKQKAVDTSALIKDLTSRRARKGKRRPPASAEPSSRSDVAEKKKDDRPLPARTQTHETMLHDSQTADAKHPLSGTVRIPADRLDSLFFQTEKMLAAKLAARQHTADDVIKEELAQLALAVEAALSKKCIEEEKGRAEDTLHESERYFRSLLNQLREDVLVIDRDYRITDVNRMFLVTAGYTRDEVVGCRCHAVSHGYDEPCDMCGEECMLSKVFDTGEPSNCVHQHLRKDGSRAWVDILFSPLTDHEGRVTHVIESARDITNLKEAQQALQKSESSLVDAQRIARPGNWDWDIVQNQLGWSDEVYRIFGLVPQESGATYDAFLAAVHPDDREYVTRAVDDALNGRGPYSVDHRIVLPTGQVRIVHEQGETTFDEAGKPVRMVGTVQDITERKHTERERDTLMQLYESMAATIHSSLLVLDTDLKVIVANCRYIEEMEVQSSDIAGKNFTEVLPSSLLSRQSLLERTGAVAETGGRDELLGVSYIRSDGTEKYLNIRICRIESGAEDESNQKIRMLLVFDDVTEQRMLQEQRDHLDRLDSIGRLAGGVAHDFNNILTGITGYAQLMLTRTEDDPKATRDLIQIRELGNRAGHLTRQLLAFGRRQALRPVALNLNDVVENISKMLRRIIGEDIRFEFIAQADFATVYADPFQVDQVIMNLAVNARDAMPDGGTLTVETANAFFDNKYLGEHAGAKPGLYVMLAMSDTGCGMDAITQNKIFEPFFTTKAQDKGTGLGLATVYGIVKQHNGNVYVYSEPGKGTTFKVYLPCVSADAHKLPARSVQDVPSPTGTETVLLVEDEKTVRTVMVLILEGLGYTVLAAANSQEAEQVFAEHGKDVDLLLADIVLPDHKGPEVYRRLAAADPTLKVLYISGYTTNGIVSNGILDARLPFLQKPFTPKGLARKVREALDAEPARAET